MVFHAQHECKMTHTLLNEVILNNNCSWCTSSLIQWYTGLYYWWSSAWLGWLIVKLHLLRMLLLFDKGTIIQVDKQVYFIYLIVYWYTSFLNTHMATVLCSETVHSAHTFIFSVHFRNVRAFNFCQLWDCGPSIGTRLSWKISRFVVVLVVNSFTCYCVYY